MRTESNINMFRLRPLAWQAARKVALELRALVRRSPRFSKYLRLITQRFPMLFGFVHELVSTDKRPHFGKRVPHNIDIIERTHPIEKGASEKRHLLLDISDLARRDLKTGIQRATKSILINLLQSPPTNCRVIPVQLIQTQRGWELRDAWPYALKEVFGLADIPVLSAPVVVSSGDIYVMPDYFTDGVVYAKRDSLFERLQNAGVSMHFMVHDNLPLSHPEFFSERSTEMHKKWLLDIASVADSLICVSQTTARSTEKWLSALLDNDQQVPPCTTIYHGADLSAAPMGIECDSHELALLEMAVSQPSFLMVGTLEPRKGHRSALLAFERLWEKGFDAKLVIIGAEGWHVADLVHQIRNHPERNRRLFWLEEASDVTLEKAYRACTCLLAASYCEGFGLPLIEAAQHKLPILARDIPIFREVAGNHASFFSQDEPVALAQAIENWIDDYENDRHIRSDALPWISWAENAERLKTILMPELPSVPGKLAPGSV